VGVATRPVTDVIRWPQQFSECGMLGEQGQASRLTPLCHDRRSPASPWSTLRLSHPVARSAPRRT
jgi:hypothetical protein